MIDPGKEVEDRVREIVAFLGTNETNNDPKKGALDTVALAITLGQLIGACSSKMLLTRSLQFITERIAEQAHATAKELSNVH